MKNKKSETTLKDYLFWIAVISIIIAAAMNFMQITFSDFLGFDFSYDIFIGIFGASISIWGAELFNDRRLSKERKRYLFTLSSGTIRLVQQLIGMKDDIIELVEETYNTEINTNQSIILTVKEISECIDTMDIKDAESEEKLEDKLIDMQARRFAAISLNMEVLKDEINAILSDNISKPLFYFRELMNLNFVNDIKWDVRDDLSSGYFHEFATCLRLLYYEFGKIKELEDLIEIRSFEEASEQLSKLSKL